MKAKVGEFLARKLSRVTSTGEYVPEIDGLRFLSIVPVILVHANSAYLMSRNPVVAPDLGWASHFGYSVMKVSSVGWIGVPIFFVLSGFVLGIPFARQHITRSRRVSIPRYLLRRITRIEPPYVICMTVYWLAFHHRQLLPHYIAGLFYLNQVVFHSLNPIHNPSWSLEVEVQFYLLAPLLCAVFAVRPAWLRRTLLVTATLLYSRWLITYLPQHLIFDHTLVTEIQFFLAGLFLADLYICGWLRRVRYVAWDVVAAAAAIGLLYSALQWSWYWLAPLLICLIFVAAFRASLFARFVCMRTVTIIGGMCYSIYLWHTVPTFWRLDRVQDLPFPIGYFATTASYLVLGLLISVPMFYFLEKPFMGGNGSRLLEKLLRRLTGRTSAVRAAPRSTSALP